VCIEKDGNVRIEKNMGIGECAFHFYAMEDLVLTSLGGPTIPLSMDATEKTACLVWE